MTTNAVTDAYISDIKFNYNESNPAYNTTINLLKGSMNARQVLVHEIENAIKSLPLGGRITIGGIANLPGMLIEIALDSESEGAKKAVCTAIISDITGGLIYSVTMGIGIAIGAATGIALSPGLAFAAATIVAIGAGYIGDAVAEQIYGLFQQAASAQPIVYDPILLDLNGDGVIGTTSIKDGVYFDHEKDGFGEKSAWVDKEDGILVIDKNNDGVINDGNEIFGDNYVKLNDQKATSGFDALRDLDSNNDGVISADDTEFNNIKILKGDGTLLTLEEAGITSINLNSTTKNTVDENGNTLISSGTFVREDGSVGSLGDFNLVVEGTGWADAVFGGGGDDVIDIINNVTNLNYYLNRNNNKKIA